MRSTRLVVAIFSLACWLLAGCSGGGNGQNIIVDPGDTVPVITAISSPVALTGQTITITGTGFGAAQGTSSLTLNGTTLAIQSWSDTRIEATTPSDAVTGTLVVTVNGQQSTGGSAARLEVLATTPVLQSITPDTAATGATLTLGGMDFGETAGTVLFTGTSGPDSAATVSTWSSTTITVIVPALADGDYTVRVAVNDWLSDGLGFTCANTTGTTGDAPVITAYSPGRLVIGSELEIYCRCPGTEPGSVTVGGRAQTMTWDLVDDEGIYRITIPELARFADDPVTKDDGTGQAVLDDNQLPTEFYAIEVTAGNGLVSEGMLVPKGTNLAAVITPGPTVGRRLGPHGETGTSFSLEMDVSGGSGFFRYGLIPDASRPDVFNTRVIFNVPDRMLFVYWTEDGAPDRVDYDTLVRIEDMHSGDYTTVRGPTLRVFNHDVPLITDFALDDFNQYQGLEAPNQYCYSLLQEAYHGFSFADWMYFTSALCAVEADGVPLQQYTRDQREFLLDGGDPRPQGYRYYQSDADPTNDGAILCIKGYNFGEEPGTLILNADGAAPFAINAEAFADGLGISWHDSWISFYLPAVPQDLSGYVEVLPADDERHAVSWEPLICSPYVVDVSPTEVALSRDTLHLTGFDFAPPAYPGRTGGGTYSIWTVYATYEDPWAGYMCTQCVQLATPVPVTDIDSVNLQITLADLDVDGDGVVPIEVQDASGEERVVIDGVLANGPYSFFLWTGVLEEGTPEEIAQSGIFSESFTIHQCWAGDPPNQVPYAAFTATPDTGPAPLAVTFDGRLSSDDGTIVNYEWDFDGDGTYGEDGDEATAEGSPGPHVVTYTEDGYYLVRLRVTDDEGETDVDTKLVYVNDYVHSITLSVTISDTSSFTISPSTLARLYDGNPATGGTPLAQYSLDHAAAGDGNPAYCYFANLPTGTNYYIRLLNPCIIWDGDAEPEAVRDFGPYSIPPDATVEINGTQYRQPPGE